MSSDLPPPVTPTPLAPPQPTGRRSRVRVIGWLSLAIVAIALIGLIAYFLWRIDPGGARTTALAIRHFAPETAAIVIFAATYLVVAVGTIPGLRLDRAGAALGFVRKGEPLPAADATMHF